MDTSDRWYTVEEEREEEEARAPLLSNYKKTLEARSGAPTGE